MYIIWMHVVAVGVRIQVFSWCPQKYMAQCLVHQAYNNNTNDQHNATFSKIIYKEKYKTKSEAIRREYYIKKNRKLRNFIKNNINEKKNSNFITV